MSIAAANVAPDFLRRRSISAQDLRRLQEPAVIHEGKFHDADGAPFHVYTIAGWLDGENIFDPLQGGATVGGEAIVIPVDEREMADAIAGQGLADTIDSLNGEEQATVAGEVDRSDHIGDIRAARDQRGVAVNHAVVETAGGVIAVVARLDEFAVQARS